MDWNAPCNRALLRSIAVGACHVVPMGTSHRDRLKPRIDRLVFFRSALFNSDAKRVVDFVNGFKAWRHIREIHPTCIHRVDLARVNFVGGDQSIAKELFMAT